MAQQKKVSGSAKLGPSRAYIKLVEGRTTPELYTRVLKRGVDIRRADPSPPSSAQAAS